jgi:hypothetical protein
VPQIGISVGKFKKSLLLNDSKVAVPDCINTACPPQISEHRDLPKVTSFLQLINDLKSVFIFLFLFLIGWSPFYVQRTLKFGDFVSLSGRFSLKLAASSALPLARIINNNLLFKKLILFVIIKISKIVGFLSHFNNTTAYKIEVIGDIILLYDYFICLEVFNGCQVRKLKNEALIVFVNELGLNDPVLNLMVLHSIGDAFVQGVVYLVVVDILA